MLKIRHYLNNQGFSLLEPLLAFALFCGISGLLVNALWQFNQQSKVLAVRTILINDLERTITEFIAQPLLIEASNSPLYIGDEVYWRVIIVSMDENTNYVQIWVQYFREEYQNLQLVYPTEVPYTRKVVINSE